MRKYYYFCCSSSAFSQGAIENDVIAFFYSSNSVLRFWLWVIERAFYMFTRAMLSNSRCTFEDFLPIGLVSLLLTSTFGVAAVPDAASDAFSFGGVVGKAGTSEDINCLLSPFVFGISACVSLSLR